MAAIRKSAILNSAIMDSANLHKKKLDSFILTHLMMAAILNSAVLNLAILYSAILIFSFKLTHTFQDWLPPFAQKTFTHSFWLNLMMAAILNSAILIFSFKLTHTFQDWFPPFSQNILLIHSDSTWWWQPSWLSPCWVQTLPSWIQTPCYLLSDWFTQKHSHSTLTLTLTNSIWLKLIHFHLTLNSAILNLAILYSAILIFSFKLTHTFQDWFPPFSQNILLIHSDSTWWWQPSWLSPCWVQTLPSWIQTPCYLLSDSLKNTLTPLWLWL